MSISHPVRVFDGRFGRLKLPEVKTGESRKAVPREGRGRTQVLSESASVLTRRRAPARG